MPRRRAATYPGKPNNASRRDAYVRTSVVAGWLLVASASSRINASLSDVPRTPFNI